MTPLMNDVPLLQVLWDACESRKGEPDAFARDASGNPRRNGQLFNIDRETWLFWKANSGNAKARRRWRRREIPNSQRAAHNVLVDEHLGRGL